VSISNQERGTIPAVNGKGDFFIFQAMAHTNSTVSQKRYAPQTPHLPTCLRIIAQHWSQALKRLALAMTSSTFLRRADQ
jgi:hypothetical protein